MSAVSGIVFLDMHGNILRLSWMKWMKPTMKTNSARLQTLHDSVSCSLNTQTSSISVQVSRVHSLERKQNQEVTVWCGIAVNDSPSVFWCRAGAVR